MTNNGDKLSEAHGISADSVISVRRDADFAARGLASPRHGDARRTFTVNAAAPTPLDCTQLVTRTRVVFKTWVPAATHTRRFEEQQSKIDPKAESLLLTAGAAASAAPAALLHFTEHFQG